MEHTMLVSVESRGIVADSSGLSDQEIKALKMVQKRLLDMEKKYNVKLNFSIAELFDESGRPDGKKLEFTMPLVLE